ncbi:MAG: TonB-dependent siderophore receptor, partial [Rubrivivax sp.]
MLFSTRQRVLTLALAGVFGTLLIAHLPEVRAQAASEQAVDIQLPAQPLGQSLTSLSRQTGVQVFAAGDLVAQRTAPAVSGRLSARQALDKLLSGTGLRSHATPGGDLVVQAPDERSGHDVLPPIRVRAATATENPLGPVHGFAASRSVTATKTDTPLLEVPQ